MQVYKAFLKILKRNLVGISIYFVIFLLLTIVFTNSGKEEAESNFKQERLTMCIINEDKGEVGTDLKEYIGTLHDLKELENEKEVLQDALYNRAIDYILFIPENFTEKIMQGETDNLLRTIKVPNGTAGIFADTQIEQYLSTLQIYLMGNYSIEEAVTFAKNDLSIETKVKVPTGNSVKEKEAGYYYFKYIPYIFMCIVIMGLGPILLVFRNKEIQDRNNCSSMSLKNKNTQLILGSLTFIVFCLGIFMVLAAVIYPDYILSFKGLFSILNAGIFILIALAIAFVFSQLVNNKNTFNMASNTIGLGFSFLGGIFVPLEIMGEAMLKLSKFVPTYWYVMANDKIQNIESAAYVPKEIYRSFGIQTAFALAIFSVGLIITKQKQENR